MGDARLLEAMLTSHSEQQTSLKKPSRVVAQKGDKSDSADRPVIKSSVRVDARASKERS